MADNKREAQRTPINGRRNRLSVKGKELEYFYRIVNNDEGRIEQFIDAGYEIVTDDKVRIGDKRVATPKGVGSPVEISVGGGQKAVLMRIKQEWHDEDEKAKQKHIDELEASQKPEGTYGEIKISRG